MMLLNLPVARLAALGLFLAAAVAVAAAGACPSGRPRYTASSGGRRASQATRSRPL
jgi:hypothetical protein